MLTSRLSEFKDLLAGISSFKEGVENLKDLLASIEEGNVDSFPELDTRLDRLNSDFGLINSLIDTLLDADTTFIESPKDVITEIESPS